LASNYRTIFEIFDSKAWKVYDKEIFKWMSMMEMYNKKTNAHGMSKKNLTRNIG